MSVSITIHCNTEWREGGCTGQLFTDAATTDEARTAAAARGWRIHASGRDYCPGCSGQGRPAAHAVVVELHPERPR